MTFEIYILGTLVVIWLLSLEYVYEKYHYPIIFSSTMTTYNVIVLSILSWLSAIILLVYCYNNIWWALKYIHRNGYDD